ncbi:MAG TPA: hypothetical protein DDZ80_08365 [Cyanobacteria bacterium UBA8803]|nr:hypothetical protein [Cyanobacteria bacterium UBA9273]HBL58516.1 hypothetical protein [Cyanobacteria bacterium UBA8803]
MSNQKTNQNNRLIWIDQTKGLAILGIVLFHFFQNYSDPIDIVKVLDRNGARLGYADVDIFFVIAGFNTSYVLASLLQAGKISSLQIDWLPWLKKRLIRLYPTYWLAILVTLVLYYFFSQINIKSFLDFIWIFMGLPGYERFKTINPGFWFFSVILQAYLVIPLIFYWCKSKPKLILIWGIIIGLVIKVACLLLSQESGLFWFILQNNFLGSYFFQRGFIYFNNQNFRKIDVVASIIVFLLGLAVYLFLAIKRIEFIYMVGFDIAFTPLIFLVYYKICTLLSTESIKISAINIFSLLGIYSCQIYLIHQPLYFVLLPQLEKQIDGNPYVKLVLSIIITTILLIMYVIAFTKLESFLNKVLGKIPKPSV